MGRELVFNKIIKSAVCFMITGGLFIIIGVFHFVIFAFGSAFNNRNYLLIEEWFIIILFLLIGVLLLVFGSRSFANPMKNGIFKRKPHLLEQADNLMANKIYEDEYIIISDRCIASKKSITDISYLEDVYLVYISKRHFVFIPIERNLMVYTATGGFNVKLHSYSEMDINGLFSRISMACPNALLGYSNEGLAYLRQMREIYINNTNNKNI